MSTSGYDDSFLPEELRLRYAVSRTLGAGACGEVKLCFSKTGTAGKKFAMKIISKTKVGATGHKNPVNDEKSIMNEVDICKRLKHVSFLKFLCECSKCIRKNSRIKFILDLAMYHKDRGIF